MSENKKKRPSILRVIFTGVRGIWRVLTTCLLICVLCGCIVGSSLLVDIIQSRGGDYYGRFEDKLVDTIKDMVKWVEDDFPPQVDRQRVLLNEEVQELSATQDAIDASLLAELESGAYTEKVPFVLVNPYGISPMSALVMFNTQEPAQVSMHIPGDTELAAVDFTFDDYNTAHTLPLYGLYPGRVNEVEMRVSYESGNTETIFISVETESLPDKLSHETVRAELMDEAAYQPGFNFTYMDNKADECKAAIDVNGDYRWYLDTSSGILARAGYCANYNGGNSIFLSCGNRSYGPVVILEMNYLGKLLNAWTAPYGAHHDIEVTDETILITGSGDAEVKEDFLYEIDRENGEIVTTLDYDTMLQVQRDQTQHIPEITNFYDPGDWLHMNSIVEYGDDLIISSRHQSTIVCNDREGNIKWMLSDPVDYYECFDQYLLTPVGNDFQYSYIQHAVEVMPDQEGNPDTLDIILFDNGDFRAEDTEDFYSRMVQYRVNEKEMTVEQIWEYGADRNELFSYRHGDADLLVNGNRLGSFEPFDQKNMIYCAYAIEVKADNTPVWECWRIGDGSSGTSEYLEYRLERLNIYAEAANDLHLGESAKLHLNK